MSELIYLIEQQTEHGLYTKVGISSDPRARLWNIQTNNPHPLALRYTYASSMPKRVEQIIHTCFEEKRTHGEWFACSADEIAQALPFKVAPEPPAEPPQRPASGWNLYDDPVFWPLMKAALVVWIALCVLTLLTTYNPDLSLTENAEPVMHLVAQAALFYGVNLLVYFTHHHD